MKSYAMKVVADLKRHGNFADANLGVSDVIAAVDLNATLNDQCAEHPHRVAVREVSPWCEMKRKVVC